MDFSKLKTEIMKPENSNQIYMIHYALKHTNNIKELLLKGGLGWLNLNEIVFNSTLFQKFSGRKKNTINHYFKSNGFERMKINSKIKEEICKKFEIDDLPCQSEWVIRWGNRFSQHMTESDVQYWKQRKGRCKKSLPIENENDIDLEDVISDLDMPNLDDNYINFVQFDDQEYESQFNILDNNLKDDYSLNFDWQNNEI